MCVCLWSGANVFCIIHVHTNHGQDHKKNRNTSRINRKREHPKKNPVHYNEIESRVSCCYDEFLPTVFSHCVRTQVKQQQKINCLMVHTLCVVQGEIQPKALSCDFRKNIPALWLCVCVKWCRSFGNLYLFKCHS